MNKTQQDSAALLFQANWTNRGYEKGESQQFWLDLLSNVFGIQDIGNFITFEGQVKLSHTSFIDGYIPSTKVLIEQKGSHIDLSKPILDARNLYPDCSLADLYDEVTMPVELRRAHQANDRAVMRAYGLPVTTSESDTVAHLFKLYEELTK